jgi:hypothetical protein
MRYALLGTILLICAVAGFVILPEHKPTSAAYAGTGTYVPGCSDQERLSPTGCLVKPAHGLSRTSYDALRITTWALAISGAVIVTFALVREIRRPA